MKCCEDISWRESEVPLYDEATEHMYPQDLAAFVGERWGRVDVLPDQPAGRHIGWQEPLPALPVLEDIISTCYHASLMREERRPVKFRVLFCAPHLLPSEHGPPGSLHRMVFLDPRPLDAFTLMRIAPAADYSRSLIGVTLDRHRKPVVWGIIQSGARWLYAMTGGRGTPPPLPPCLQILVSGPGRVEVHKGSVFIGKLDGGRISGETINVFNSTWLPARFAPIRASLIELHNGERTRAGSSWAVLDERVISMVAQHAAKRLISVVKNSRHGGTLILLPPKLADEIFHKNRYISMKYRFNEEEPRRRFSSLLLGVMNALAASGFDAGKGRVTPDDYAHTNSETIADLDEAIFEVSHQIAAMAAVDGAVVLTNGLEVVGFAGEISGDLPDVPFVAKACDTEGQGRVMESTEGVGTRHRSVYRLCNVLHEAMGIVVSQDGGVRFIRWSEGVVTYWNHEAIAP
jgi:hypothetical protein